MPSKDAVSKNEYSFYVIEFNTWLLIPFFKIIINLTHFFLQLDSTIHKLLPSLLWFRLQLTKRRVAWVCGGVTCGCGVGCT